MRGEHDCGAEFTLFTNDVEDDVAGLRIQARGRLVEEEHVRAADEGGGEGDALLLTTRETANRGAVESINAEAFCELFDRVRVGVHGRNMLEQRDGVHGVGQAAVLEHNADLGAQLRVRLQRVFSEQAHGTAGGFE